MTLKNILAFIGNLFNKKRAIEIYSNSYDSIAPYYESCVTRQLLEKETEKLIHELGLKPGLRCLDLGCGTGQGTELIDELVSPGGSVIGCDISESMLNIARKKLEKLHACSFIKKDMLTILSEQGDNSFDSITSFWALGYNSEIIKTLQEVNRVLVKDGHIAILVNTQESLIEFQRMISAILAKNPLILKHLPPVNFPSNLKSFSEMIHQSGLKTENITQEAVDYFFDSGNVFVSWIKKGGACAGFKYCLRKKYEEQVFRKIKEVVDKNNGIKVTFKFIRFIGTKSCLRK